MARAIGIDPGTVTFDVCGRDGEHVFLEGTFPTAEVGRDPSALVEFLRSEGPVDLVVGPSGYGLPWVDARDLGPRELDLLLLGDPRGGPFGSIVEGMGGILRALGESGLPLCFCPGVVHLPTVPDYRKVNRVDMGTADKLCAVALGVWDQARRYGMPYADASFVYVEMGGAFTAVIAVEGGMVVDGSGGTSGALGYRALGAMDGELAYLLGGFPKGHLVTGGMVWIAGVPDLRPEEVRAAVSAGGRAATAWEAFLEGLEKQVAAQTAVLLAGPREILLSGRLSRIGEIEAEVVRRLERFAPVRRVDGFAAVPSEAAQGAALLGQGLTGGSPEAALVKSMRLREACGSVLDNLFVCEAEEIRRRHPRSALAPSPFWQRS